MIDEAKNERDSKAIVRLGYGKECDTQQTNDNEIEEAKVSRSNEMDFCVYD
ncbi:hypothetical protein BWQ96_08934 [Gracilariopsis chorda]|uniref:Uncharacterized protein n=1 Tax=Gracilariopsis chorda TaxID=448386 RepID=A0A2V3IH03_9FLOR|nr:hypothetical protein BWQ96_08934 [Gracilariopsis chorda]|eukprot:PXF41364.1 hypothetical protein BWQ96_08934 [Gracilariopsis chorda]